jgi:hypothetical protein
MTAEESAFERFCDEPYFEVLIQSIARKATAYTYAKIKCDKTLGAGNSIDCIIREQVFKTINKLKEN